MTVAAVAVVLAACTSPAARPGEAVPSPSPTATEASTPRPTPTPATVEDTLVMWSREDLPTDIADRAAALPDVVATAFVRSDTVDLLATSDAAGRPVDRPGNGFRIPVDVAAVEPARFAATLPRGAESATVAALEPGHVLLSAAAAELRGLGPGATVDLAGRPGLTVAAVIPDGTVRRAEIILHAADADAVGLEPDGSLVVRHSTPDAAALAERLRALVDPAARVRVVGGDGARRLRAPLVLSLTEVKARFGEFAYRPRPGVREVEVDADFVATNIVTAEVPLLGSVRCHRAIVADLAAALAAIETAGHGGVIDPSRYGGCYHPRRISTAGARLSHHSWGIAIDINVDLAQPGGGTPPPATVIAAFAAHGFRWGGDFLQPDNHHFEWVGPAAQEEVADPVGSLAPVPTE